MKKTLTLWKANKETNRWEVIGTVEAKKFQTLDDMLEEILGEDYDYRAKYAYSDPKYFDEDEIEAMKDRDIDDVEVSSRGGHFLWFAMHTWYRWNPREDEIDECYTADDDGSYSRSEAVAKAQATVDSGEYERVEVVMINPVSDGFCEGVEWEWEKNARE